MRQTLEGGASVVIFSGDKLLGGPQAGIAVGSSECIQLLRKHPMARALRIDGPTQTALVATLEAYAGGAAASIPFWAMATMDIEVLQARSEELANRLGAAAKVIDSQSVPGAGSVPGEAIPSPAIRVSGDADALWSALISANPPVLARRRDGALEVDLRTIPPSNDGYLADLLEAAL